MAAWVVITVDDLNDYLVGDQVAALRTAARAKGQSDPFPRIMADRVAYVRNRISRRIHLSRTLLAIPPELKTQSCLLIIEAMQGRIPMLELTEDQRQRLRDAKRDLDLAAKDDFPISMPDDPVEPDLQREDGGAVQVVRSHRRDATRDSLAGF